MAGNSWAPPSFSAGTHDEFRSLHSCELLTFFLFILVRGWCGFCRTLPGFAERSTLFSLFSDLGKELWISLSGFESLGAANFSPVFTHLSQYMPRPSVSVSQSVSALCPHLAKIRLVRLESALAMACRNFCAGMGYHHCSSAAIVR